MKNLTTTLIYLFFYINVWSQNTNQNFVTTDIDNFWNAYDKITSTKDSATQYNFLNKLYIEKGTAGLKAFMQVKGYTAKSWIDALNKYPLFWQSIRSKTLKTKDFASEIEKEVEKLRKLYPALKPAKVYFTIGALQSNGTTLDSLVLIGAEMAMGDKDVVTTEFSKQRGDFLKGYYGSNPTKDVVFLNVHEYVHTQQKRYGYDLLSQSVFEGVAEFMAVQTTGKFSSLTFMSYGKSNDARIKAKFSTEMFYSFWNNWLYNDLENEFKERDLGYYVGYAICEKYFEQAKDKKQAIKELIELDYGDRVAVENFVEKSGYFTESLSILKAKFNENTPRVLNIKEFKNGDQAVNPNNTKLTIEFSAKMNKNFRSLEIGELGEDYLLKTKLVGFSEDGKSITYEIALKPNQRYQLIIDSGFRNELGIRLNPYLIDFKTTQQ